MTTENFNTLASNWSRMTSEQKDTALDSMSTDEKLKFIMISVDSLQSKLSNND